MPIAVVTPPTWTLTNAQDRISGVAGIEAADDVVLPEVTDWLWLTVSRVVAAAALVAVGFDAVDPDGPGVDAQPARVIAINKPTTPDRAGNFIILAPFNQRHRQEDEVFG